MLSLRHIHLAYDDTPILRGINLDVAQSEIVCLLGKSGSGKTTVLRIVAGLERDYTGTVQFDDQTIDHLPTHQRGFGLMFQDFALFPHMSVKQNITFGLRMQGKTAKIQSERLAELLELVGLQAYGERDIAQLSGGEQQRVALARSLAPQPQLLMLDEPLGALDAGLRQRLVMDLRHIIKEIGVTALYVTHDQEEAYAIADRIAVMNTGRIEQIDSPEDLYHHPQTEFVARFLGLTNIISSEVAHDWQLTTNTATDTYLIHPSGIALDNAGQLTGKLASSTFKGDRYELSVAIGDVVLNFPVSSAQHIPDTGEAIKLRIVPNAVLPLENPPLTN